MAGESENPQTLRCANCGAPLPSTRAVGQTIAIVCSQCGSINDASNPNVQIIQKISQHYQPSLIPLGTRGEIRGKKLEVIGYLKRCDSSGFYHWREYLLFNPYLGFFWLLEFEGHWTLLEMVKEKPILSHRKTFFQGRWYKLFLQDKAEILYVWGEFYWRVRVKEKVSVEEYIAPPYILSREYSPNETVWSLGEYLQPQEVMQAFKIKPEDLPSRSGVAACQPSRFQGKALPLMGLALLFSFAALFLQFFFNNRCLKQTIFEQDFTVNLTAQKELISSSFQIPKKLANVAIQSLAPTLSNNWLYLNYELINETTGEVYSVGRELSYYYGSDSDGSWSEGSQNDFVLIPSIPEGIYHLEITPEAGIPKNPIPQDSSLQTWIKDHPNTNQVNIEDLLTRPQPLLESQPFLTELGFGVRLIRDVPTWSNYWISFLLFWVAPILIGISSLIFEIRRWSASNVNETESDNSDDSDD